MILIFCLQTESTHSSNPSPSATVEINQKAPLVVTSPLPADELARNVLFDVQSTVTHLNPLGKTVYLLPFYTD
jgi:hypothetical protein